MIKQLIRLAALFIGFTLIIGFSAYITIIQFTESEETVIVPDLTGKHVADSLEMLAGMGLNTKVKDSRYSRHTARHHVIHQQPPAGAEIKQGRDVQLVISKGPDMVFMPDLLVTDLEQARLVIEANGLRLDVVSEAYAADYRKNHIMAQHPPAGKMVARETGVNLLVSLGPRPRSYMMPDLSGLSFASAVMRIEEAGLTPGRIRSLVDSNLPVNTVVSHDPPPGALVTEGGRIDLVVNRESEQEMGYLFQGGGVRLFRYKLEYGFLNRHIKATLNCFGLSVNVVDDYQRPASEVWLLVPARRDATVLLYENGHLVETRVFGGW